MRRLGILFVLVAVAGCTTPGAGERCDPLQYSDNGAQGDCADGLACVYPTAANCGVSYCCTVDSTGNITDKHSNCQPDPTSAEQCMLERPDLSTGVTD